MGMFGWISSTFVPHIYLFRHPGMVCLCGMVVFNNLMSLLSDPGRTLSFNNWQKFPITKLYNEILSYNTFRRMLLSLRAGKFRDAVQLYRSRFAGFLEDVEISPQDEDLADFLTSEGVLLRPVASELKYHVTSPLIQVDALVRQPTFSTRHPSLYGKLMAIFWSYWWRPLNASIKTSLNLHTIAHLNLQRCMSTVLSARRFLK